MAGVEVWLDAGGDFVQTENGDLKLAYDTISSADATNQRLQRLLTTNARIVDAAGNPISFPGDLFHPDYGASEPALVDSSVTPAFLAALEARILGALLKDPTVSQNPLPVVTVAQADDATIVVSITARTVTGNPVSFVLPT